MRSTSQKKKRVGLFAQRGEGGPAGGSIGQSALFCHDTGWLKNSRFCPFLGMQKSDMAIQREQSQEGYTPLFTSTYKLPGRRRGLESWKKMIGNHSWYHSRSGKQYCHRIRILLMWFVEIKITLLFITRVRCFQSLHPGADVLLPFCHYHRFFQRPATDCAIPA